MPEDTTPNPMPITAATPTGPIRPGGGKTPERRSLVRRMVALVRRWGRDTFNREQLLASARALAWVAPLTLLIWIYAEREQQAPGTARFQIILKSADPTQVATFISAGEQNVMANLKGPKARLDEAMEKLDPRSGGGPVQIVIEGNRPPGQYEIDILAQIQKDSRLGDAGVTVEDCQPRHVRVDVDSLQEVELDVRPDPLAKFLAAPIFNPPKVRVTLPAALLRGATGEVYAKANLPQLPPGAHSLKAVRLTVEGLTERVAPKPDTVSATVEVGQSDVAFLISSMPVFAVVSGELTQKYFVKHDQFLTNVWVFGPPEKIKALENFTLTPRPQARFQVTADDVGGKRVTRELEYVLPEGIRKRDDAPTTISFEMIAKEAS
jgi:hypothetical protein